MKNVTGSCHCGAVRYEADVDLPNRAIRCNCSICSKARAWFTFVNGDVFRLLSGEDNMISYQWTPTGKLGPFLAYRLCKNLWCAHLRSGRRQSSWEAGSMRWPWLQFDNAAIDELAAVPLKFIDNLHDRFDRSPADAWLL